MNLNFFLLLISFLPLLNNISILTSNRNQQINYSLNNNLNYANNTNISFYNDNDFLNKILNLFESKEDSQFIYNIINDLQNHPEYLEPLISIIAKNYTILNYNLKKLISIIANDTNDNLKFYKIIKILEDLVINHEELLDCIFNLTEKYPDLFFFLRIFKKSFNNTNLDIEHLILLIKNNSRSLFNFLKNFVKNRHNGSKLFNVVMTFIEDNIDLSINILKIFRNNTKLIGHFIIHFIENDHLISQIIISFLENQALIENFLDLFLINNSTLFQNFINLLVKEKAKILYFQLPKFIAEYKDLFKILIEIIKNYMKKQPQNKIIELLGLISREIIDIYINENLNDIKNAISEECIAFINYTVLGYVSDENYSSKLGNNGYDKNISNYYLFKFLSDTSKNINDLLTYENCLDKTHSIKGLTGSILEYMDNSPTFIILIINLNKNNNIRTNFSFIDKSTFIYGGCFPQGLNTTKNKIILKNGTESYYHCTIEDYKNIISLFIENNIISFNFDNITHEAFEINNINVNGEFSWKNIIPFLILIIPIFIYFFLIIYRNISIKKRENILMIHKTEKIIEEDDDNDDNIDNSLNNYNNGSKIIEKFKIVPKWYKLLNECFNFKTNLNELFNNDSNEINKTNLNNKGIIYIKGIIGISVLLTILGQLYLIFFNIPMKKIGKYQFYELMSNFVYIFIFMGLRYSPRVLFSCSGYTLTYKYLSFIDREEDYYLIKFLFFHLYKYIILILFVLFLRYSLYDILCLLFQLQPMLKIIDQLTFKKPKELFQFFLKLLNINSFLDIVKSFSKDYDSEYSQDLFDYYWMPFNEIFFFIFGVILISLGYKLKIRIDYVIISLIIIIVIMKIVIYYIFYKNKNVYTTLYYYISDYGRIMLNPLFNLSYFLIGMYFGLINYSVQKGIIKTNKDNSSINDNTNKNSEKNNNIIFKIKELSISPVFEESNLLNNRNKSCVINNIPIKKQFALSDEENLSKKDNFNEINICNSNISYKNINLNNIFKKDIIKKIESMPFLLSTINIIEWHRKDTLNLFFRIILIFLAIIIITLSIINMIVIRISDSKIDEKIVNDDYNENDKLIEKLLLESLIFDPTLNFIYLFDIELFVFFIQWVFFIFYMKGYDFFINFFNHVYWSFFTKSYFSFLLVCNPVILYMFFETENVIKLNILNICLYYSINLVYILIVATVIYILIDLPLKKFSNYIIKNRENANLEENEDENNEENINDDEEEK